MREIRYDGYDLLVMLEGDVIEYSACNRYSPAELLRIVSREVARRAEDLADIRAIQEALRSVANQDDTTAKRWPVVHPQRIPGAIRQDADAHEVDPSDASDALLRAAERLRRETDALMLDDAIDAEQRRKAAAKFDELIDRMRKRADEIALERRKAGGES